MDTYSEIEITFIADLVDETISFDSGDLAQSPATLTETWVPTRKEAGQVTQGTPTATAGERSAINFVAAFEADYNVLKTYTIERVLNVVTIKSNDTIHDFGNFSISANPSKVSHSITNSSYVPFTIDSIAFGTATGQEDTHVKVILTTSETCDRISGTFDIENSGSANPFEFNVPRGASFLLVAELDSPAETDSQTVQPPTRLDENVVEVTAVYVPSGSTVTVDVDSSGLSLEYSINGTDWQSSNVFTNVLEGTYTFYVRDSYGSQTSLAADVTTQGIATSFFSISKSNSIRFKNVVVWGDAANYKNDENTLASEVETPIVRPETQLFQSADIITTQFKSNYPTNAVSIIEEGVPSLHPVVKRTNYMGRKDLRSGLVFNLGDGTGRSGVWFNFGTLYDYDTQSSESSYTLNGRLPEYAQPGNYIRVGSLTTGTWHVIQDILYIEDRNIEVMVISESTPRPPDVDEEEFIGAIYDLHNYEVYEFTIDFVGYLNKCVQVQIVSSGGSLPSVTMLSEPISVRVRHEKTLEIRYSNKHNTDLVYAWGLENKIRIPLEKVEGQFKDEPDVYETDTSVNLLADQIYEKDYFEFRPISKELMRKVILALSHTDVFLDGVKYVKDTIEEPIPLGETNMYTLGAVMTKAKNVYNSDSGAIEFNDGNLEIPALIPTGTGYVKYQ